MSSKKVLNTNIIERLEEVMQTNDLKRGNFADIIGYSRGVVSDILNGNISITDKFIKAVCFKFELSERWLKTGEGPKETQRQATTQPDFPSDDFVFIRQVNGKISAGSGVMPDESVDLVAAFRKDWIKRKGGKPEKMSLIKVDGDSMEPTFLSGDLVLIDHGRDTISARGGIYAIAIDDEIMIKRIQPVFPDKFLVISDNKEHYPAFEIERSKVRVNGKVIWYARELER